MPEPDAAASDARREHELKCWPPYFDALVSGDKTFEVRPDDRDFQVHDDLLMREWSPFPLTGGGDYTGREAWFYVRYVLPGGQFGVEPGHVVLSVQRARCHVTRDVQTPACGLWRGHEGDHRTDFGEWWSEVCDPDSVTKHRGPWKHERGSDSIDQCQSCGRRIGK